LRGLSIQEGGKKKDDSEKKKDMEKLSSRQEYQPVRGEKGEKKKGLKKKKHTPLWGKKKKKKKHRRGILHVFGQALRYSSEKRGKKKRGNLGEESLIRACPLLGQRLKHCAM